MQSKFNFFQQIYYAVIKPQKYYQLTRVSTGRFIGFVFLLLVIITGLNIIPIATTFLGASGLYEELKEDMPYFELADGELYVEERVELVEDNGIFIIDTEVDRFEYDDISDEYEEGIYISKTNLIAKRSLGRMQEINFTDLQGLYLDKDIIRFIIPISYFIIFIAAIFMYLFGVGAYFFTALIYSLIGLFVSSVSNVNLKFLTIFKVAIYSKVLMKIIVTLFTMVDFTIPGIVKNLVAIAITMVYVVFGVLSHKSEEALKEAGLLRPLHNANFDDNGRNNNAN